jgi:hypothetical protein
VIHGTVTNEAGQPLLGASVAVRRAADSTLVGGKITAKDGVFRVDRLALGEYLVEVSMIGFTPQQRPSGNLTAASPTADLGAIRLAAAVVMLQGVEARSARRCSCSPTALPTR